MKRNLTVAVFVMLSIVAFTLIGNAQERYPSKPITIVVAQGAGGSTDLIARSLHPFLSKELNVPIVVQNQTGAAGDIANNFVWKAKPDGYTLIMTVIPSFTVRQLMKKPAYDVLKMSFIYGVAGGDYLGIAVPFNSPIKNFADLKKAASEKVLTMGGLHIGSNTWYAELMMRQYTGLKFQLVPYDGGAEAATAAIGGHVDITVLSMISLVKHVQNKQLRLIAGFSDKHDPDFPDLPMMVELGYKDVFFTTRQGLAGPPGMPKEIVDTLASGAAKAVKEPLLKSISEKQGFTLDPMPGPEFHKWTVNEFEKEKALLGQAGALAK
jgi:tripartite-type tricarboxylate transporter receptor subunit TctC